MPKVYKSNSGKIKKPVHPNSRKAMYLARQTFHEKRVNKVKSARSKHDLLAEKMIWFKEHIDTGKTKYMEKELVDLVVMYLNRFETELEQISIIKGVGMRQGQPHVARETAIEMRLGKEKNEFDTVGIEVPDLMNSSNFEEFKSWNGEVKYIQKFKLRKISQKDFKKVSEANIEGETEEAVADNVDTAN